MEYEMKLTIQDIRRSAGFNLYGMEKAYSRKACDKSIGNKEEFRRQLREFYVAIAVCGVPVLQYGVVWNKETRDRVRELFIDYEKRRAGFFRQNNLGIEAKDRGGKDIFSSFLRYFLTTGEVAARLRVVKQDTIRNMLDDETHILGGIRRGGYFVDSNSLVSFLASHKEDGVNEGRSREDLSKMRLYTLQDMARIILYKENPRLDLGKLERKNPKEFYELLDEGGRKYDVYLVRKRLEKEGFMKSFSLGNGEHSKILLSEQDMIKIAGELR